MMTLLNDVSRRGILALKAALLLAPAINPSNSLSMLTADCGENLIESRKACPSGNTMMGDTSNDWKWKDTS